MFETEAMGLCPLIFSPFFRLQMVISLRSANFILYNFGVVNQPCKGDRKRKEKENMVKVRGRSGGMQCTTFAL
jgi:hypothetical protein